MRIDYTKMSGHGNDFVIVSGPTRAERVAISRHASLVADRQQGVGCDQIMLVDDGGDGGADIRLDIVNSDGSPAEACGNGTRCVADLVMGQRGLARLRIATAAGLLEAWRDGDAIALNMGTPRFDWQDIPLAAARDTAKLDLSDSLPLGMATNIGNPHCVFVVEDAEAVDVAGLGSKVETHPLFPDRTNVEFISAVDDATIRMRVWERGVGITQSCGSGAVASAVVAHRLGLVSQRRIGVVADGGRVHVHLQKDAQAVLIGPTQLIETATIDLPSATSEDVTGQASFAPAVAAYAK